MILTAVSIKYRAISYIPKTHQNLWNTNDEKPEGSQPSPSTQSLLYTKRHPIRFPNKIQGIPLKRQRGPLSHHAMNANECKHKLNRQNAKLAGYQIKSDRVNKSLRSFPVLPYSVRASPPAAPTATNPPAAEKPRIFYYKGTRLPQRARQPTHP
jgi:hypothetical protein